MTLQPGAALRGPGRTAWLAVFTLGALVFGVARASRWPSSRTALPCDARDLRLVHAGAGDVVACAPGSGHPPPPAAWSRTLGQRLDLNRLSVEELSAIPGIGRKLGAALAGERATRHGFSDWSEVAAVKGVGRTKLDLLQGLCALEPARDGG